MIISLICLIAALIPCGTAYGQSGTNMNGNSNQTQVIVDPDAYFRRIANECEQNRKRINALNPGAQVIAVRNLPTGVFVDHPAFWKSSTDTIAILSGLYFFKEPFSADQIAALSRTYPNVPANDQLAAAILVRYSAPKAISHLRQLLMSADHQVADQAASIACKSRISELAPEIVHVLNRNDDTSVWLVLSIDRWANSQIEQALLRLMRKPGENQIDYALALARMGNQHALPLLQSRFEKVANSAHANKFDLESIQIAAATHELRPTYKGAASYLKSIAGYLGDSGAQARGLLCGEVWNFRLKEYYPLMRTKLTDDLNRLRTMDEVSRTNSKYILDAYALVRMLGDVDRPALGTDALELLKLMPRKTSIDGRSDKIDIAEVCLATGIGHSGVAQIMGADWVRRSLATRDLRPIPWIYLQQIQAVPDRP
ncbi:MAG TPA: hypothetical protein VGK19_05650 [Capsulimonadaceae bacterium]|jgi:hypothetical protein